MSPNGPGTLPDALDALEFDQVATLLRRYVASFLGSERLDRLLERPRLPSPEAASEDFARVREAVAWLRAAERVGQRDTPAVPRFEGVEDIRAPLRRLSLAGVALEAPELRAMTGLLEVSERIREATLRSTDRPKLCASGQRLPDFRQLLGALAGKILPNGEISSLASSALARVRRQIEKQGQLVETSLERFVRKHADTGVLQDKYVTMRNGRTVVPVKASLKSRVDGVVHGASSSGQTVFVEPLATIEANNRLVRLREEEQTECLRILREMTDRLRAEKAALAEAVAELGALEFVFARARFWRDFRCCEPRFSGAGAPRIVLDDARHPLLQDLLERQGSRPVPMSLRLERGQRIMVVSGPNAGGKTVVLKTVGLLAAMAQAGIPVPAEEAEFPWFDGILADIGDAQSIAESRSTFSAHVAKLAAVLKRAAPQCLVVLDELGAATDPEDGGALAVAIVERLLALKGFAVVSTHLPELRMYGLSAAGVCSASMGFDDETLSVTYRLQPGIPGQSAGLEMARRFGLPPEVLQRAQELKGGSDERAARYLAELRKLAAEQGEAARTARLKERDLEKRREELEREAEARAAALRKEAEERVDALARRLEARYRKALDASLQKITSTAETKAARAAERRATQELASYRRLVRGEAQALLGNEREPKPVGEVEDFAPGTRVLVASMGITGAIVSKLDAGRWEVRSGSMRLKVAADDLTLAEQPRAEPVRLPTGVRLETAGPVSEMPSEINVIGKTADEALLDVDKFLDRAVLANRTRLRVIHGFGKDVLRRELWQMFARHAHVAKYYQAQQHEGGAGATIVEIHGA